MTAPRISAARFGFSVSMDSVRSGCGTTISIVSPAFQLRLTVASSPGVTFSALPLTRSVAPVAHAGMRSFTRKPAVARLPHGHAHGVRRRIVGVLNDRDRAARTLPDHCPRPRTG